MQKFKKKKKNWETKLHAILSFPAWSFAFHIGGSFEVRDHLRSNLGIISDLGIICGRGSVGALYRTRLTLVLFRSVEHPPLLHRLRYS